jgi:ATP synthase protein I
MPREDPGETNRKTGLAYAAGFGLFASVAACTGVGWLLDKWLATSPWLMVAGVVVGAIAGFYQFIRITSKLN